jgi:hypothetical protein
LAEKFLLTSTSQSTCKFLDKMFIFFRRAYVCLAGTVTGRFVKNGALLVKIWKFKVRCLNTERLNAKRPNAEHRNAEFGTND